MMHAGSSVPKDHAHQKSFKRKYRKLRHKFKEVMRQSDELFRQEQLAKQAIRRVQEQNTRILDFLLDLNESTHIPKDRRHNIGSPSRATPPRFMSPTMLAALYGDDLNLLQQNDDDIEDMELDEAEAEATEVQAAEKEIQNSNEEAESSDDDDDDEEDEKTAAAAAGSKYNSDDEEDDEAYREEIREWNYRRGIAGTPPRSIREKMKADEEQARRNAEEQTKKAAAEAAAERKSNGVSTTPIKQEELEEALPTATENAPQKPPLNVEDYRRGQTPEYLRAGSPFLMTLEEEEAFYNEIHERYNGDIPLVEHAGSSAAKAEGDPRNPMSVYCWLRKYQPHVFLQNEEAEGGGKRPRGRGGRRKAIEADVSGDEASAKKRRRTNGTEIAAPGAAVPTTPSGRGRGGGAARNPKPLEPPSKRQRSAFE